MFKHGLQEHLAMVVDDQAVFQKKHYQMAHPSARWYQNENDLPKERV